MLFRSRKGKEMLDRTIFSTLLIISKLSFLMFVLTIFLHQIHAQFFNNPYLSLSEIGKDWDVKEYSGKFSKEGSYLIDIFPLFMDSEINEVILMWRYKTSDDVRSVAISSDGKYIVAGCWDGNIYFLNRYGTLLWKYETGDNILSVAITPDGRYIVAGSDSIYLFSRDGWLLWKYWIGSDVLSVAISSDGKYIVAGTESGNVYLLNNQGDLLWNYRTNNRVVSVAMILNEEYIVAGSWDGNIYFFNREGRLLWKYKTDIYIRIAITPDGRYIVAGRDGVYLLNGEGKLLWMYWIGNDVLSVAISSDGKYIVAGGEDHNISLFNRKGELLWKYKTEGDVYSVAMTPDGKYIVVGGEFNHISLFASLYLISEEIIEDAKITIYQIKSKYKVEEAEILLFLAEQAFNEGDYYKAIDLALKAKYLAFDIDQDGVPNDEDFAPYIKNEYIYASGIAIILILAMLGKIYHNYRKKKKEYKRKMDEFKSKVEKWKREGYDVSEIEKMLK